MKGKTEITLRINKNYFQDEQLLHLLFLVRRQKTLKKEIFLLMTFQMISNLV